MRERGEARGARRTPDAIRERLSYANVMSTIAVFGVLAGGGAYAASKIGPEDIAKNAVRAKHIKKKQVRTKHIKNSAVTKAKLAEPGISGLVRVTGTSAMDSNSHKNATATCPAGKRVIGSGGAVGGTSGGPPNLQSEVTILNILPSDEDTVPGFVVVTGVEDEPFAGDWQTFAHALCAE